MCQDTACGLQTNLRTLTFEAILTDPLIRLVMDSDGVSSADLVAVLEKARMAVLARAQPKMMAAE